MNIISFIKKKKKKKKKKLLFFSILKYFSIIRKISLIKYSIHVIIWYTKIINTIIIYKSSIYNTITPNNSLLPIYYIYILLGEDNSK